LASNRDTSNGPDWKDVAAAMGDWRETWNSNPQVLIEVKLRKNQPTLHLTAKAPCKYDENGEAVLWVSVSADMLTTRAGGFEAALLLLLYDLDAKALAMCPEITFNTA